MRKTIRLFIMVGISLFLTGCFKSEELDKLHSDIFSEVAKMLI